jgi:hypothetical protein
VEGAVLPTVTGPGRRARILWWVVGTTLGALGLLCALVTLSPGAILLLAVLGAAPGYLAGRGLRGAASGPPAVAAPVLAGSCGLGLVAVAGLVGQLGAGGLVACLLPGVVGWATCRRGRPGARGWRRPGPDVPDDAPAEERIPPDPLPPLASVPLLSTPQLCWVWRVTYCRLDRPRCPGELEHLSLLRRACLDELEARDPTAFRRWFPTARAAGDPSRHYGCRPRC